MYCNYQSTQNHHAYYVKGSNTKVGNNVIVNNIIRAMQKSKKVSKGHASKLSHSNRNKQCF